MPVVVGVPNLLFSIPDSQGHPEDHKFLQDSFERLAYLWDALDADNLSASNEYEYSKEMKDILCNPRFRALFKGDASGERMTYCDENTQECWRAIREKGHTLTPERLEAMRIAAKRDRLFAKPPNPLVNPIALAVRRDNAVKKGSIDREVAMRKSAGRQGLTRAIR